jgi:hypothetical protein
MDILDMYSLLLEPLHHFSFDMFAQPESAAF